MRIQRSTRHWWVGAAAALFVAAIAVLPSRASAQTSAAGSLTATLAPGNTIAVTLTGVTPGASYNIFTCTDLVSRPAAPDCVIGTPILVASASGSATGSVTVPVTTLATSEVLAQNASNPNEIYAVVINGNVAASAVTTVYVAPATTAASATPTCAAGTPLVSANGIPSCATTTTGLVCTGYTFINGTAVCTSTGYSSTAGMYCTGYTFVNGTAVCTSGSPYTVGQLCGSYTFINGVAICNTTGAACPTYTVVNGIAYCLPS